jgi:trans-2-enoyl-CoA reductase
MSHLLKDSNGAVIQGFVPDPAKSQVPINLAGSKVFKRGAGGDYDIATWIAINITPSTANLTYYFNSDSTKTKTVVAGADNVILFHPSVTQITISGTDASVEVQGM